ncbi:MAG: hypothetical protein WCF36_17795 [Candidatus Nanopelagicales bacterium]
MGIGTRTAAAGAALLLLTGCSGQSQEPSQQTSPTEAVVSVSPDLLLGAEQMTEWNGSMVWSQGGPASGPAVALCPWPSPEDLAAVAFADRTFVTSEGALAGRNVVMAFESPAEAASANETLQAALTDCGGSIISQPGTAMTWTRNELAGEGSDDATFEFVGVDAVGEHVSVVEFSLVGQDANWETDPILDSLEASRARLGEAQSS